MMVLKNHNTNIQRKTTRFKEETMRSRKGRDHAKGMGAEAEGIPEGPRPHGSGDVEGGERRGRRRPRPRPQRALHGKESLGQSIITAGDPAKDEHA